jgi:hypothetical protein
LRIGRQGIFALDAKGVLKRIPGKAKGVPGRAAENPTAGDLFNKGFRIKGGSRPIEGLEPQHVLEPPP